MVAFASLVGVVAKFPPPGQAKHAVNGHNGQRALHALCAHSRPMIDNLHATMSFIVRRRDGSRPLRASVLRYSSQMSGRKIRLDWAPTERPSWRKASAPTSAEMLAQIDLLSTTFNMLPATVRTPLADAVVKREAVAFVLSSNRLELVGTQDLAETDYVCTQDLGVPPTDRKHRETLQTFRALQYVHRIKHESLTEAMADGHPLDMLLVTPDSICHVHEVLMEGLMLPHHAPAGRYRSGVAAAVGFSHCYSAPDKIENDTFAWTDAVNDLVFSCKDTLPLADAFKLAALVLFHSVNVHAFSDGNGRMCRILANSMLMHHHFFPVFIQPVTDEHVWRDVYISALEACRADKLNTPADLAALLIESSWAAWNRIGSMMREWVWDGHTCIGTIVIGSRVIDGGPTKIQEHVASRYVTLCHGRRPAAADRAADVQAILTAVMGAIPTTAAAAVGGAGTATAVTGAANVVVTLPSGGTAASAVSEAVGGGAATSHARPSAVELHVLLPDGCVVLVHC